MDVIDKHVFSWANFGLNTIYIKPNDNINAFYIDNIGPMIKNINNKQYTLISTRNKHNIIHELYKFKKELIVTHNNNKILCYPHKCYIKICVQYCVITYIKCYFANDNFKTFTEIATKLALMCNINNINDMFIPLDIITFINNILVKLHIPQEDLTNKDILCK